MRALEHFSRSRSEKSFGKLAAILGSAVLLACGGEGAGEAPDTVGAGPAPGVGAPARPAADTEAVASPQFDGTLQPTTREADVAGSTVIDEIRTARHERFDRIVLEFRGSELPGYTIEYAAEPAHECGSGQPVRVAGGALLHVRLSPAEAHAAQNGGVEATVAPRDRSFDYPAVRQLRIICDFEAIVELAIGVDQRRPYRVLTLSDPTRLVIDVRTGGG